MTAAVYADRARSWAIALEEDEAATRGLDRVEDARAYVARRTGEERVWPIGEVTQVAAPVASGEGT